MNYHEHNDARDRDNRLAVEAWNAARARMLAAHEEYELGAITLYMPKYALKARLAEARVYNLGVR